MLPNELHSFGSLVTSIILHNIVMYFLLFVRHRILRLLVTPVSYFLCIIFTPGAEGFDCFVVRLPFGGRESLCRVFVSLWYVVDVFILFRRNSPSRRRARRLTRALSPLCSCNLRVACERRPPRLDGSIELFSLHKRFKKKLNVR